MVIYDNRTGNIYFDCQSYAVTIKEILNGGGQLRAIQIYTTARVPVESWVAPVSDERLVIFARQLSSILNRPQRKKATGKEEEALQNQVYSIPIYVMDRGQTGLEPCQPLTFTPTPLPQMVSLRLPRSSKKPRAWPFHPRPYRPR